MKGRRPRRIAPARSLALQVLRRVEAEGAFASLALNHALNKAIRLTPQDRALVTELVYGTLRWRRRLDFALAAHVHRRLEKVEPVLLRILRLSAYQLLFLDRIPDWAAVDQGTELALAMRSRRAAAFVNGVLRSLSANRDRIAWPQPSEDPVTALAVLHSFPEWMVERWLRRFDLEATESLLASFNRPPPLWLRANTLRTDGPAVASWMGASGLHASVSETVPHAIRLPAGTDGTDTTLHASGQFHAQDAAAQAVCHLFRPRPGERILDACAAPGGKTATLAQMMNDQGEIQAVDNHPVRIRLVRTLADRLGISCIQTEARDLTRPSPDGWGTFDGILLDAPCSALGVLRRHPEAKWRLAPDDLRRLATLQRQLLDALAPSLRPGGKLVYSVCTPSEEEGPELIRDWLDAHPEFSKIDPRSRGKAPWHSLLDAEGALRTWPDPHDMDAHFAVLLVKQA